MSGSGMSRKRFADMVEVFDEEERLEKQEEERELQEKQDEEQRRLQEAYDNEQRRQIIAKFNVVANKWKGKDLIKSYNDAATKQAPNVGLKHPASATTTTSTTSMTAAMANAAVIPGNTPKEVPAVVPGNAVPPAALTTPMAAPSVGTGTLSIPSHLTLPGPHSGPATPAVSGAASPLPSGNSSKHCHGPDSPNAQPIHKFATVPLPAPKQATSDVSLKTTAASAATASPGDQLLYGDEFVSGYTRGHKEGNEDGFKRGREEGDKIGFTRGYKEGDERGYKEGHRDGYYEGLDEGRRQGNVAEYNAGLTAGISQGYGKAVDEFNSASLWGSKRTNPAASSHAAEPAPRVSRCWSFCRSS